MRALLLGALVALSSAAIAQQIPIPAFTNTFSAGTTRGFWFQAPTSFIITGVRVPDESLQGTQVVEISRLPNAAPAFPATVQGTQLFYAVGQPSANILPCNILVNAGDFIGVLGACGSATMANSYGPTGAFQSTILGQPVTLTRYLTQTNLATTGGNQLCSSEVAGSFGRVEVYVTPAGPGVASTANYGTGCYSTTASFYENFATSASFDLANTSISMLPTGSGYTVLPGITSYVPPSVGATSLGLTDDSITTVALSSPFPFNGGVTTSLEVCSNGFVSVATGNGTGFTPAPATTLSAPATGWWSHHDYNPGIVGSGAVKFEQIGSVAYVTWDGVWDFGGTSVSNANTFQFQFDTATGMVHIVFQTMSGLGNGHLVGYSPGGASVDPGNRDISATLAGSFSLTASDTVPLALNASARPITGTSINLVTTNIPAGTILGATVVGTTQINPGLDLSFLGMPGCFQYTNPSTSLVFFVAGSSANVAFNIPNVPAFVGLHVYAQSATFSSGFNSFGVISSNGLDLGIGNS